MILTNPRKAFIFFTLVSATTLFITREYGEQLILQRNEGLLQNNSLRSIKSDRTNSSDAEVHSESIPLSAQGIDASPFESIQVTHDPWRSVPGIQDAPNFTSQDIIYGHRIINDAPIVNEEFKVIFFHMAKVASSEWKRFFSR